jgi:hypothetical protein
MIMDEADRILDHTSPVHPQSKPTTLADQQPAADALIPHCHNMAEHPSAKLERERWFPHPHSDAPGEPSTPLSIHIIKHGLAYTIGSALGSSPPSAEACLSAFLIPNKAGLTAGARAWSKHFHRSSDSDDLSLAEGKEGASKNEGWWGVPHGPVAVINAKALSLFHRVMDGATWRNLHWLPHEVLVYEVRVPEGYGMRWSQDQKGGSNEENPWIFRGFVEPMMDHGHELGWRH